MGSEVQGLTNLLVEMREPRWTIWTMVWHTCRKEAGLTRWLRGAKLRAEQRGDKANSRRDDPQTTIPRAGTTVCGRLE